jgi:hypothetical protein
MRLPRVMILVDETADIDRKLHYPNLSKSSLQPRFQRTVVRIGYMSKTTVTFVRNLSANRDLVVKALRLPRGNLSARDTP